MSLRLQRLITPACHRRLQQRILPFPHTATSRGYYIPLSIAPSRPGYVTISTSSTATTTTSHTTMSTAESSTPAAPATSGFYSLKAALPSGKEYDFEQLRGKVVLIVNTASKWCVPGGGFSAVAIPIADSLVQRFHPSVYCSGEAVPEAQGQGLCDPRLPLQPSAFTLDRPRPTDLILGAL